ncbi:MAG: hypothetical protein K1X35_13930, partial [Caulobacteraceae bacterium]|nr:hypothetical protein [Caulobacteraceae bacterium]
MTAMSRRVLGIMGLIGLFALAACNLGDLQAPGLARDKDEAARAVFKAMQKGDLSGVPLGPEMLTPEAQAAIPNIFASIPKGEPTKVKLLNWHSNWSALTGARTEDLETNHQYTFPNASIDVTTVMQRQIPAQGQPGPWKLRGFHFKPSGSAPAAPPAKAAQAEAAPAPASAPTTPPAGAAAPPSPTPARATPPRA